MLQAPVEQIEITADLARVGMAAGYIPGAHALIGGVVRHLAERGPGRLDDPLRMFFTIYRVLWIAQQPDEAHDFLMLAHQMLHRQAEDLDDEQRATFLADVPVNRQIVEAWEAAQNDDTPKDSAL